MKKILAITLLATLTLPAFAADAPQTPPQAAPTPASPTEDAKPAVKVRAEAAPKKKYDRKADELAFYRQLIKETPELKGVDPETAEGKKTIREYIQKNHKKGEMPEVSIMMKVMRTKSHAKMRDLFDMPQEEFAAIEPFLARVELLRAQKLFVDIPTTIKSLGLDEAMGGGNDEAKQGIESFIKGLLGTSVDPLIKECQDATQALKAILEDPQSNAAEKSGAVARVRKAKAAYNAALEKAQLELRSVLTPHQEALLVDYGILD